MVFVTVKTDIVSPRGVAITEEQDIVYREEPDPNAPPATAAARARHRRMEEGGDAGCGHAFPVFRAHVQRASYSLRPSVRDGRRRLSRSRHERRAHDASRTRARSRAGAKAASYIASRNVRPLFVNRQFMVCGEPSSDGSKVKLWVVDDSEALALSAEAELAA